MERLRSGGRVGEQGLIDVSYSVDSSLEDPRLPRRAVRQFQVSVGELIKAQLTELYVAHGLDPKRIQLSITNETSLSNEHMTLGTLINARRIALQIETADLYGRLGISQSGMSKILSDGMLPTEEVKNKIMEELQFREEEDDTNLFLEIYNRQRAKRHDHRRSPNR